MKACSASTSAKLNRYVLLAASWTTHEFFRGPRYKPTVGDVLQLSSADSSSFAGPFKATIVDVLTLTNGKVGLVVKIDPPAYYGLDPLSMSESDKFLLVARSAHESLADIPAKKDVSVHIAECKDWQSVRGDPVDPAHFSVVAWGEAQAPDLRSLPEGRGRSED